MADLELREVPAREALTFARVAEMAFGNVATDEEAEVTAAEIFDPEWAIGVYDAGHLVATTSATPMDLTLPAGPGQRLPVTAVLGVTAVTVLPTHRRRGLLNRMMAHQLGQFRDRNVSLALLTASESVIYGRYGYGLASSYQSVSIATKRSAFVPSTAAVTATAPARDKHRSTGRLKLVGAEEAANIVPGLHDRARKLRPGEVSRSKEVWEQVFRDPPRYRHGAGARTYVVHEGTDGRADGYATYRYQWKWRDGLAANSISVEDLYAASTEVEAALWRFVFDIDLVEDVTAAMRPVDDPLRWRLADPRRLRTTAINDSLWARLIDIPTALTARGYSSETDLVLEVEGNPEGRYFLSTGATGGNCRPAKKNEKVDIALGHSQLGAIFLGGCRLSTLAAAGLIEERRRGAVARADAAFISSLVPFCGTRF